MRYEWDKSKAATNLRQHGVDFQDAIGALEDPNRLEESDDRFDYDEDRDVVIGMSRGGVLFVVATYRDEDTRRIIPAERQQNMKKTATTQVTAKSGERKGATDWKRVKAMSDADVRKAALADPDAQPLSKDHLSRMRRVSRVKALRERMGLTQREFAAAFHLPITTLRDWEQRRSSPDAPARALLLAIERDPKKMMSLLSPAVAV